MQPSFFVTAKKWFAKGPTVGHPDTLSKSSQSLLVHGKVQPIPPIAKKKLLTEYWPRWCEELSLAPELVTPDVCLFCS